MATHNPIMRLKNDQIAALRERDNLKPQQRRDFDYTFRSRLLSFLEFIGDANDIIEWLPRDQLKRNKKIKEKLSDYVIGEAMTLVENLLDLLDYAPIQGSPEKAHIVLWHEEGPTSVRSGTDDDLERNLKVHDFVNRLSNFYQTDSDLLLKHKHYREKQKWEQAEKEKKDKGKSKKEEPK